MKWHNREIFKGMLKMLYRKIKILMVLAVIMLPIYRVSADSGGYIVKFNTDISKICDISNFTEITDDKNIYSFNNLNDLKGLEGYVEYYETNDKVDLIEGEETIALFRIPSDELYSEQWQIQMVNADYSWELETYGNQINVAVIDSGCYPHDDLKNNLVNGWNYLENTSDTSDNNGHGTHVSGIIAAEMNDFGIVGVAPKAKIVPLKCFDPTVDTYATTLVSAIYDAVDKYDCQIINMSWGLKSDNEFLSEAIDYAYEKGAILVAAVGNKGTNTMYYPAAYENVIGVGSVGIEKNKSIFSQYNKSVFIVAPGEKVKSTYKDNSYTFMQGTSQAAPYVSGMAALALSVQENISNKEFVQMLIETTNDLGYVGYDTEYGYGLINGEKLINRILNDIKYYVSPINIENDTAYVLIKNNTEDVMKATSIFSEYDNDKLTKCLQTPITLMPNKEIIIKKQNKSKNTAHFLWSELNNLMPLATKREME